MKYNYPVLPPSSIIKVLNELGFIKISQKGSHLKLKNYITNRICIIPMHKEVARGTLKSILEQADIELDYFLSLL